METGSSELEGVERKDAARRLTRAREPGHLMRLPRSHLTRQSWEARQGTGTRPVILFVAFPTKQARTWQGAGSGLERLIKTPLETPKVSALASEALHGIRPSSRHVSFLGKGRVTNDSTSTTLTQLLPRRTSVQEIN